MILASVETSDSSDFKVLVFAIQFIQKVLKTDKDKEEMKHEEELREVMEKHAKELQDLGTPFAFNISLVITNVYFVTVGDWHGKDRLISTHKYAVSAFEVYLCTCFFILHQVCEAL